MSTKPHDKTFKKDLLGKEKGELIDLILNLLSENRDLKDKTQELQKTIDQKILNNWTWDEIEEEFLEKTNLSRALAFLRKILEEKAICTNSKCPPFKTLGMLSINITKFTREYKGVLDPETAEIKFKDRQHDLNQWENDYWELKLQLSEAFHEIFTIGLPNRIKKQNFFETREFLHQKHIEIMDKCDDVRINIDPSSTIKSTLDADNQMLSSEDFNDYGNDIFKEKRKELEKDKKKKGDS